ncbi:MAG: hypothetical protein SGPRY_001471, partial [Prymnesium sp.]
MRGGESRISCTNSGRSGEREGGSGLWSYVRAPTQARRRVAEGMREEGRSVLPLSFFGVITCLTGQLGTTKPTETVGMPWRPLAVCLALLLALLVLLHSDSAVHEHTAAKLLAKLAWKNASVRPPLLLVLVLGGWGWVVSVCNRAGLDVERVLNGRTQAPRETYHAALTLLCLLLSMRLLHLVASETAGVVWRPWLTANVLLHGLFLVLALLPCDVFFGNSRISLLRAVWDSVIAPCAPVTFWHVLVADYMTSLAKAFSDLQLTACISYRIFAYSPEATYCLKVYSDTGEVKNLYNAAKCAAQPHTQALSSHRPPMGAVVTLQVHMDWGLFRSHSSGLAFCGAKPVNLLRLREPLLITQNRMIYGALKPTPQLLGGAVCTGLFDMGLRFMWALSVFGGVPGRGLGMFFFEVVEILRRTVWAVFRIEWE